MASTTTAPDPQQLAAETAAACRWPVLTGEDEAEVLRVLRDGDLSGHPVVGELEDAYRARLGVRHALAHCNGTAALMAAYFALGVGPGDEVIVPSATWWSTVLPLVWLGATPVFADAEPDRLGLCPADVEAKLTPRTRAVAVTHLWGMPAKMTRLLELARGHGLAVVEDASHAHGATWRGRPCGTLGDVGVFSLQGQKLAPAGEGGVLVTDRDDLIERATLLGDPARIGDLPGETRRFAATGFGFKTRIASLSAAVAKVQLRHLDARNAERAANVGRLAGRLRPLGVETFDGPPHVGRVYFEWLVRPPAGADVDRLIAGLTARGCSARPTRYPMLHRQPFFTEGHAAAVARGPLPDYAAVSLPALEAMHGTCLALPPFPSAGDDLLDAYADAFAETLAAAA